MREPLKRDGFEYQSELHRMDMDGSDFVARSPNLRYLHKTGWRNSARLTEIVYPGGFRIAHELDSSSSIDEGSEA